MVKKINKTIILYKKMKPIILWAENIQSKSDSALRQYSEPKQAMKWLLTT